jgi:hypothetical protein
MKWLTQSAITYPYHIMRMVGLSLLFPDATMSDIQEPNSSPKTDLKARTLVVASALEDTSPCRYPFLASPWLGEAYEKKLSGVDDVTNEHTRTEGYVDAHGRNAVSTAPLALFGETRTLSDGLVQCGLPVGIYGITMDWGRRQQTFLPI